MSMSELELDLGTVRMNCTHEEISRTLAALLGEMRAVLPKLREDEREALRQIMSEVGALTVGKCSPTLRANRKGTRRYAVCARAVRSARANGTMGPQRADRSEAVRA